MGIVKSSFTEGVESDLATMHPLLSWRSILAGLLIAFFSMLGLLGLGMAVGGIGMGEDTSLQGAGMFTGIWFLVSALVSIFFGSYFAARVSKFQNGRIGSAQGLVIAALFLGFFLFQGVSLVGSLGRGAGNLIGGAGGLLGQGVQKAAQNEEVQNTIGSYAQNFLGDLNLRSDPETVARGVANHLVQGNPEGAKNYLAHQAGISPVEADQRIAQLQQRAEETINDAKEAAGTALQSAGWSLFLLVLLGGLSAIAGGALGSVANFRRPLSVGQEQV